MMKHVRAMVTKIGGTLALGFGLLLATVPSTAAALNFPTIPFNIPIPVIPLPDLCLSLTGCPVQFTLMHLMMDLQKYTAMVQDFQNIGNIGGMQGTMRQVMGIIGAANAAPQEQAGNVAARSILNTSPQDLARLNAIDGSALGADGEQEQQQLHNAYLSSIAGNTEKSAALMAEQQVQRGQEINGAIQAFIDLNGSGKQLEGGL